MTNNDRGHSPIKLMFQLLQCLHHLQNLIDGEGLAARAFRRKADELNRFVRPAIPTPQIMTKVRNMNEAWVVELTEALRLHYQTQIDFVSGSLKAWNLSENDRSQCKSRAIDWAKRQFGRKLKPETITEFEKLFKNIFAQPKPLPNRRQSGPAAAPGGVNNRPASQSEPVASTSRQTASSPDNRRQSLIPKPSYVNAAKSPPQRSSPPKAPRPSKITRFPSLGTEKYRVKVLLKEWAIPKISKDILLIGTSNFSRIPWVDNDSCQILSYPGMKLQNLLRLVSNFQHGIKSSDPGRKPSKILVMCGLNDRNLAPVTNEVTMKKIVKELERQFPGSKIYLAEIPYSNALSSREKDTIEALNKVIRTLGSKEGIESIPRIHFSKFRVGSDNIHWTENCARIHFNHFLQHLN